MRSPLLLSVAVVTLALAACEKKDAPATGGAPAPGAPKAGPAVAPEQTARIVGGSAGTQPVGAAGGGALPAGHPPMGGDPAAGAMPAGHPPMGGDPAAGAMPAGHPPAGDVAGANPGSPHGMPVGQLPAGPGGSVTGTVRLAPERAADVKAGAVLFIMVRQDVGEARGPLLAAKRIPVTGAEMFPHNFEVTSADMMMQGTPLSGPVRVEARVDSDGDAISKTPGDVTGKAPGVVTAGSGQAAEVTLNEKL